MIRTKKEGFTLIELLVVIAIIGILSSVVLASLNSARAKGSNAAIKSGMANMRAQAAIYYDTNGNYGTAAAATSSAQCTTTNTMFKADATFASMVAGVQNAYNAGGTDMICSTDANPATKWAVAIPLKVAEGSVVSWCVDSNGASKGETSLPGATGVGAMNGNTCI